MGDSSQNVSNGVDSRVKQYSLDQSFLDALIQSYTTTETNSNTESNVEFIDNSSNNNNSSNAARAQSFTSSRRYGNTTISNYRSSQNTSSNSQETSGANTTDTNNSNNSSTNSSSTSTQAGTVSSRNSNYGGTSSNSHLGSYQERLVRQFDKNRDGIVSDQETYDYIQTRRRLGLSVSDKLPAVNQNADIILSLIDRVDPDQNGTVTDTELINALLSMRGDNYADVNQEILSLVSSSNNNRTQILNGIQAIDKDSNGDISDLEVLTSLLGSKNIDISSNLLEKILSYNNQYTDIKAFVDEVDINPDGIMSDNEVLGFLLALRRHGFSAEGSNLIDFLKDNPNLNEIENSVALFDPDNNGTITQEEYLNGYLTIAKGAEDKASHAITLGLLASEPEFAEINNIFNSIDTNSNDDYTENELVQAWLKFKKGDINADSNKFYFVLNQLSNSSNLVNTLSNLDSDSSNSISNPEMIDFLIEMSKGNINGLSQESLNAIYNLNSDTAILTSALNAIDTNGDGVISDEDTANAILSIRRGELAVDSQTLNTILSYNANKNEIESLINSIDTDGDGILNEEETFDASIKYRKGIISSSNQFIFDSLMNTSDYIDEVEDVLNAYDPDGNGEFSESDFIRATQKTRQGSYSNLSANLVTKVEDAVATSQTIKEIFNTLDPNNDGNISTLEMIQNYRAAYTVNGTEDLNKKAVLDRVLTITNPNFEAIISLRNAIDTDDSGIISNAEAINGILRIRSGALENYGKDITMQVLDGNSDAEAIYDLISVIDTDSSGSINNPETMKFITDQSRSGVNNYNSITNEVLSTNPEFNAMKSEVDSYGIDLNSPNLEDDLYNLMLKVRKGQVQGNYFDLFVQTLGFNGVLENRLVLDLFDTDKNGVISDTELMKGLQKKLQGQLSVDPAVIDSILSENPKYAHALNLIQKYAGADGTISEEEFIVMVMDNHYKKTLSDADYQLLLSITDHDSKAVAIKNIMDWVGVNSNGIAMAINSKWRSNKQGMIQRNQQDFDRDGSSYVYDMDEKALASKVIAYLDYLRAGHVW